MAKSKIEWCDATINPVKGLCPMACSYCYARRMYKRFKWNPEIRFDWSVANDLARMKPKSRVFWGSTFELFHSLVDPEWQRLIFEAVKRHPELTHIFLTKQPQNLIKWSPFPENCWVGASATTKGAAWNADKYLSFIEAKVKFLSLEPLLEWSAGDFGGSFLERDNHINWLIIGQQTPVSAKTQPKIEWIQEIVEAADKAGVPVFLKDNLKPLILDNKNYMRCKMLITWAGNLRQELPHGR